MGIDIQGESPQARRKQGQKPPDIRQAFRQRQMEKHRPSRRHKRRRRTHLWRIVAVCQGSIQFMQGKPCLLDASQGQIGVSKEQAR